MTDHIYGSSINIKIRRSLLSKGSLVKEIWSPTRLNIITPPHYFRFHTTDWNDLTGIFLGMGRGVRNSGRLGDEASTSSQTGSSYPDAIDFIWIRHGSLVNRLDTLGDTILFSTSYAPSTFFFALIENFHSCI